MKTKYNVVKVLKDAMTGEIATPSLMLIKNLDGVMGEILYTGTKAGALRILATLRK